MAPVLPRYQPAVLGITAIAAAFGIYLLLRQVQNVKYTDIQHGGLHRRNAVRRVPARRRGILGQVSQEEARVTVDQAIANLRHREAEGESYGRFRYTWDEEFESACELLPSSLPTIEEIRQLHGVHTIDAARKIRLQIEEHFVRAFLREELDANASFPPSAIAHLTEELKTFGLDGNPVRRLFAGRETEVFLSHVEDGSTELQARQADGNAGTGSVENIIQALDGPETVEESDSRSSFDLSGNDDNTGTTQNMLDLLYHIAGYQARRNGYIHRGVECNSCGACPIQGVRFHCANCFDYDLCETCEAGQVHLRTHVLFKIRIPGPTRGNVKDVSPVWYTGKPDLLPENLPKPATKKLLKLSGIDKEELDALYDQYRNLANHSMEADGLGLSVAIDRAAFDKYFACTGTSRHTPPSLVWDRIFAYYDEKQDGLIDFEEFVIGLTKLQDTSRDARLLRVFKGYDLDGDGYVDRKDFLRMFRSYYAWCKQLNRELINTYEEDQLTDDIRELIESSQPISAAFSNTIPNGHASRAGVGKEVGPNGNLTLSDGHGALDEETNIYGDRTEAIGVAAIGNRPHNHPFRSFRPQPIADEPVFPRSSASGNFEIIGISHVDDVNDEDLYGNDPTLQVYGWPPINDVELSDITNALGCEVPIDEIMDPVDRSRVFYEQSKRLDAKSDRELQDIKDRAVQDRWQRRQFYLDQEEGMTAPPGYTEQDSSDDDFDKENKQDSEDPMGSRRPSMRSRSSSKVRFEDDLTDTDYETRSNTSSRSIPVGERWGGFEITEAEKEVGKEILYQAVQQGFNELLDHLFKDKEDLALAAAGSQDERQKWAREILEYKEIVQQRAQDKDEALRAADMLRTEERLAGSDPVESAPEPEVPPSKRSAASADIVEQAHQLLQGAQLVDGMPRDFLARTEYLRSVLAQQAEAQQPEASSPLPGPRGTTEPAVERRRAYDLQAGDGATSPDPMLPQNRPNAWDEEVSSRVEAASKTANSRSQHQAQSLPVPPSPTTMDSYLDHYDIEAEAKRRGGQGKISFVEFAAKMIADDRDENERAFGKLKPDEDRTGKWPKSASLGRLGFVDKWLDWAHF